MTEAVVLPVIDEEAENFPVASTVPSPAGLTDHVTVWLGLLAPLTVAANCWLAPAMTVAVPGETTTEVTVAAVLPSPPVPPPPPPPQPAATKSERVTATARPRDSLFVNKNAAKPLPLRIDVPLFFLGNPRILLIGERPGVMKGLSVAGPKVR